MDERIVKKKLAAAHEGVDCAASEEEARVHPHIGVAEIIKLDSVKNRKKAATSNDQQNVPIDEHIGRHLKAIYDDVLKQPIPERFLDLLDQLGEETPLDE